MLGSCKTMFCACKYIFEKQDWQSEVQDSQAHTEKRRFKQMELSWV